MKKMFKFCNCLSLFINIIIIYLHNSLLTEAKNFDVYWNVPTFMCHKRGMKFEEVSKVYNMIQNTDDKFNGDKITILYHGGDFPTHMILENNTIFESNNVVPQKGNLKKHLEKLQIDLDKNVTLLNFSGIGILDYERWRPVFRQNFNRNNRVYQDVSIEIEKKAFEILTYDESKILAEIAFNYSAQKFFEETIKLVKQHRPYASWGYYDYPKCFYLTPEQSNTPCGPVHEENDRMVWLWDLTDILYPSIYAAQVYKNGETLQGCVERRLVESHRIANKYHPPKKILPYLRYRYRDNMETFVTQNDYLTVFKEVQQQGIGGIVIWGSQFDVDTRQKCVNLLNHLNQILGPIINDIKTRYNNM